MALFGHAGHLFRVGALFGAALLVFLALQALLVPKDFGRYGHYRPQALDDNRARALVHAGRAACLDCHSDAADAAKGGPHEHVRCEACHGALARHAADPTEQKAVRPDARVLCARCHEANVARPASFPQVEVAGHAGGEDCTSCHRAHNPRQRPIEAAPQPVANAARQPTPGPAARRPATTKPEGAAR